MAFLGTVCRTYRLELVPECRGTWPGRLEMGRGSRETLVPLPLLRLPGEGGAGRQGFRAGVCLSVWEATSHGRHNTVTTCVMSGQSVLDLTVATISVCLPHPHPKHPPLLRSCPQHRCM